VAEFRLSPAAQGDLDGIFDYTVQQWGLEQAVRYTLALENACAALAEAPARAQDCSHIRPGYRRGAIGRHFIYFLPYRGLRHRGDPHSASADGCATASVIEAGQGIAGGGKEIMKHAGV